MPKPHRSFIQLLEEDMKKRRKYVYACSHNRFRGSAVCANKLWAPDGVG